MARPHRAGVFFCIAVIAVAAILPGFAAFDCALLEPQWILLADAVSTAVFLATAPSDEQLLSLVSLLPSRAPPSILFA
jgi:hypothetical protein